MNRIKIILVLEPDNFEAANALSEAITSEYRENGSDNSSSYLPEIRRGMISGDSKAETDNLVDNIISAKAKLVIFMNRKSVSKAIEQTFTSLLKNSPDSPTIFINPEERRIEIRSDSNRYEIVPDVGSRLLAKITYNTIPILPEEKTTEERASTPAD